MTNGTTPEGTANPNPKPPSGGFNTPPDHDPVNHPTHYASDAKCESCGQSIECIEVIRHLPFTRGNAIKYLWRAGKKGATVEDLKKAIWYIQDEISQLEGAPNPNVHRLSKGRTYQSGVQIWNFPVDCIGADDQSCLPAMDGTILHFSGCPAKPDVAKNSEIYVQEIEKT